MRETKTFSRAISQRVLRASLTLGLADRGLLFFKLRDALLVLEQGVNASYGRANAGLDDVFGQFFFVEDDDFFYVANAALQVFAESDDFANHDGRARNRFHYAQLAALDALRDFNFAFAGEQRNGAHLAQVHAHRIVGFLERSGCKVKLDVFTLFEFEVFVGSEFGSVKQVDALGANGCNQIVEIVSRADLFWKDVIHIAVCEIALFLASLDQVLNIVFEFVVDSQKIPTPPARTSFYAPDRAPVRALSRAPQKKISVWKSAHRAKTSLRSPAKKAVSIIARSRMAALQGFAWVAREP